MRVRAWAVLVLISLPAVASANGWPKTLVTAPQAVVYARASTSAPVRLTLTRATMVQVRRVDGEWCDVVVRVPGGGGKTVDAWMRAVDLLQSAGMTSFWNRQFGAAAAQLDEEVRAMTDPAIVPWLQFYLGYAQWATGRLDAAHATFAAIARRGPPRTFAPHALVAMSRVASVAGDLDGALAAYRELLSTFPALSRADYVCDIAADPYPVSWEGGSALCAGAPRIARRIETLERLIGARADGLRLVNDPDVAPIRRAEALLAIGRAWEDKTAADPGKTMMEGVLRDRSDARAHYEAAIAAAPGSAPAGDAAWRLIPFSAPYEWEGDWQAQATWTIEQYGGFLTAYPKHALAGEARFQIALARWAQAGYPEVFQLIFTPDDPPWPTFKKRQSELDQWFDTRGFGGGRGPAVVPDNLRLPEVVEQLRGILADHSKTASAPMAQYWMAVILDYGLNQAAAARVEYQAFLKTSSRTEPFATKARRRLAALATAR